MNWPKNNQCIQAGSLFQILKKTFEQGAKWERVNPDKDIKWEGPSLGTREGITCIQPKEQLTAAHLEYVLEDQGYDFLDEFIALVFRLGMEQGRRSDKTSIETELRKVRLLMIADQIKELATEK